MNQVFVFQECHSPESFRPEGLELPHLEKWTARHRLRQPLQCPEEQWGQKYVWCRLGWRDSLVGVGKGYEGGDLSHMADKHGWYRVLPDQGLQWLCSLELPGVLGKLRATLCLYCGTQSPWSRALPGGMQWRVPLDLSSGMSVLSVCPCPSFPNVWCVESDCWMPPA